MRIRKLPALLVNQIAAGEVIERPASVVKELIENSLDAGASQLEIAVEDGGRRLIRVSDNGAGMEADELPLAVAAHATSKLDSPEGLAAIGTLGFRGEALASIASVARLRISSRPPDAEAGHAIKATGDEIGPVEPVAAAPGTVIEVRDLFFNTPARRKFMRAAATEFGHISDVVSRIAMAHHQTAFRLTHNGREVLNLPAGSDWARRAVEVLGTDIAEGLLRFEGGRGNIHVCGVAAQPSLARATAKHSHLCINRRPVRDRSLLHAVKEAYRGLIPPDRHPLAAVFITMDPADMDVNVHPAKAEVRFRSPSEAHGAVLAAVRQCLLGADLTPTATLPDAAPAGFELRPETQQTQPGMFDAPGPSNTPSSQAPHQPSHSHPPTSHIEHQTSNIAHRTSNIDHPQAFVDYFRRMDPKQKGFVYQQVKELVESESGRAMSDGEVSPGRDGEGADAGGGQATRPSILQVHDSYVVTEDEQGLLIVDQHALHERVMFEQLRERVVGAQRPLESQRLLMPANLRAGAQRQAVAESLAPVLERIGIELAPAGPEVLAIHAFPSFLFDRGIEPGVFVEQLLDRAEAGELGELEGGLAETTLEDVLHEVLDMMACKAAVKAGDRLTMAELEALLARREQVERSSNCPHGRPTSVRLTLRDLEKHFKRSG